jgi:hypothetical protein
MSKLVLGRGRSRNYTILREGAKEVAVYKGIVGVRYARQPTPWFIQKSCARAIPGAGLFNLRVSLFLRVSVVVF